MKYTFRGGTHLDEHKNTCGCKIEKMPAVRVVSIPLAQHIGAPAHSVVNINDTVSVGQKIGDVDENMLGCPVHASVSGKVIAIQKKTIPSGAVVEHVVIENDMLDTKFDGNRPFGKPLETAEPEELISFICEAGISGMGGAAFPTYAKLRSALGRVDKLIINSAECEPFITVNHRLLLERSDDVVAGMRIILRTLGIKTAYIAIEDNKLDAAAVMEKAVAGDGDISVKILKTKYPQGDERQLIYALTKQEVPTGKLPADVGCVIFNAETCAAVYRAFTFGEPLIKRIVTVDGDCVRKPRNLLVPIGTSVADLVETCGGLVKTPKKLISGGPMMGVAQWDFDMPVTKSTSAILLFSKSFGNKERSWGTCIRCGKCVHNCPMHLMPNYIAQFSRAGDYRRAGEYEAMSCVECGTCSYNCPGGVEIVQYIRAAKAFIRNEKARAVDAKSDRIEKSQK